MAAAWSRGGQYVSAAGQSWRDFMEGKLPSLPGGPPLAAAAVALQAGSCAAPHWRSVLAAGRSHVLLLASPLGPAALLF